MQKQKRKAKAGTVGASDVDGKAGSHAFCGKKYGAVLCGVPNVKKLRAHKSWRSMINRCGNSKHDNYKLYGGAGITICESWRSFPNFFKDMGERPVGMVLDREDNTKGYSKENCRWVTFKESTANRKNTVYIGGVRVFDLAKELKIPAYRIYQRISRGWGVDDIRKNPNSLYKRS